MLGRPVWRVYTQRARKMYRGGEMGPDGLCFLLGRVQRFVEASWLWLVCAAQGYDEGAGAHQEEGGDGGADADEQACGGVSSGCGLVG